MRLAWLEERGGATWAELLATVPHWFGIAEANPFGITRERARGEVEQLVGRGGSTLPGKIPFTDRAKSVLGLS